MTTFQQIVAMLAFVFAWGAFDYALRRIKQLETELEQLRDRVWELDDKVNPRPETLSDWMALRSQEPQ